MQVRMKESIREVPEVGISLQTQPFFRNFHNLLSNKFNDNKSENLRLGLVGRLAVGFAWKRGLHFV